MKIIKNPFQIFRLIDVKLRDFCYLMPLRSRMPVVVLLCTLVAVLSVCSITGSFSGKNEQLLPEVQHIQPVEIIQDIDSKDSITHNVYNPLKIK